MEGTDMASALQQTDTDRVLVAFGAGIIILQEQLEDDALLNQMELRFIDNRLHLFLVAYQQWRRHEKMN
jgi:hypothetical protein